MSTGISMGCFINKIQCIFDSPKEHFKIENLECVKKHIAKHTMLFLFNTRDFV